MSRRFTRRRILALGMLATMLLAACFFSGAGATTITCIKCEWCLKGGMTLQEAEALLGPFEADPPFGWRDHERQQTIPCVQGDETYRCYGNGVEVYIGLRDGRICDKWWGIELLP